MAKWKLCASTTFEILALSTCTLCHQKSYISKSIQPIFEIFASEPRSWEGAFGQNVSGAQVFYFCNSKLKTLRIDIIWNFPLSTWSLSQQKSYISKGIQPIFANFASARRCWRWTFEWKVSGAQVFYFCNGEVKTLRIDNIWNFATFNLYSVQAKILYLQKYSADFRNLCLRAKILRGGIWAEFFRCAGILLLQQQAENFAHRQHLKFCHFQPVHCASKNPISPKVFNRFSKSLPEHDDVEGGHLGGKFQLRRYFTFAMARWKLCASTTFEICHFQPVQCASKNPISQNVFNRFSNSLPQLEDVEGGHFGWKFHVRR